MAIWPSRLSTPVDPMETVARCWWQSMYRLPRPPHLTNLREMARSIRGASWN